MTKKNSSHPSSTCRILKVITLTALALGAVSSLFSRDEDERGFSTNPETLKNQLNSINEMALEKLRGAELNTESKFYHYATRVADEAKRQIGEIDNFYDIRNPFVISADGRLDEVFDVKKTQELFGLDLSINPQQISENGLSKEQLFALFFFREYQRAMCPNDKLTNHGESCKMDSVAQLIDLKKGLLRAYELTNLNKVKEHLAKDLVAGMFISHCIDSFRFIRDDSNRDKYNILSRYSNGDQKIEKQQREIVLTDERARKVIDKIADCFHPNIIEQHASYIKDFNWTSLTDKSLKNVLEERSSDKNRNRHHNNHDRSH